MPKFSAFIFDLFSKFLSIVVSVLIFSVSAVFLGSCATGPRVTRVSADTDSDLSGRWNDTDSRLTAESMIFSMLDGNWLARFSEGEDREPVVIIGSLRNNSSEHINSQTFVKVIEKELTNSGRVIFVASGELRQEIREEREDQQSNATLETAANLAAETGADFILQSMINSQTDVAGGKRATLYRVDMELINLEDNKKVWIDSKEIKKIVERDKTSW